MSQQDTAAGCRWSSKEVCALISIWGNSKIQNKFDGTVRDAEVYKLIRTLMADKNYPRTLSQIKTKIKSLKREYRKSKDMLKLSGSDVRFRYFDKIDRILGDRIKCEPFEVLDTVLIEEEQENSNNFMDTILEDKIKYEPIEVLDSSISVEDEQEKDKNLLDTILGDKIKCGPIEVLDNISIEENEQEKSNIFIETLGQQVGNNQMKEFFGSDDRQSIKDTSDISQNVTSENEVQTPQSNLNDPLEANYPDEDMDEANCPDEPLLPTPNDTTDRSSIARPKMEFQAPKIERRPLKRNRMSLKEVIKRTVASSVDKFIEFEREVEEKHNAFQQEFLELERKKLKILEQILNK